MKLIKHNITLIDRFMPLIDILDDAQWSTEIPSINNETVGRHFRHISDFYLQFIQGLQSKEINYDRRERSEKFELQSIYAKDIFNKIKKNLLLCLENEDKINIKMNQSIFPDTIESSINRELMFLYDHAIHHAHIIQIAITNQFPELNFKEEFYSPSTLESLECVQ